MARKNRIEYAGAVYHVYNRGNYRKAIFEDEATGLSFEKTLFEVVERCGWKLYAYVIMKNHYHLALETPEPNLVEGMQYLQSVFATRFNRYRKENGHVFEGRYHSPLVGEGEAFTGLLDYIHLNPVRARICEVDQLRDYSLSSYHHYWQRRVREGLDRGGVLYPLGFQNTLRGMKSYEAYLKQSVASDPRMEGQLSKKYKRGWFIGEEEEKRAMLDWLMNNSPETELSGEGYQEIKLSRQEALVKRELKRLKKTETDVKQDLKGVKWKVEIVKKLRKETTAKNGWIANRLNMGHPTNVSKLNDE